MSYAIYEIGGSAFSGNPQASANALVEAIHTNGLGLRLNLDGSFETVDSATMTDTLGGAETDNNLRILSNYFNQLRNLAIVITRNQFRENVADYVQSGNRSVESALRNLQNGIPNMLEFLRNFTGKDIKLPVKYLWQAQGQTDYGQDPELTYSDVETGTYHTLQELGTNQMMKTWSTYLEDTPSLRRYLRYVDSLARQFGMRVVYCPKQFQHIEELTNVPARPNWRNDGNRVVRQVQANRFSVLYVSLSFDYGMFADLTTVETEVQPGQRRRTGDTMDYAPIFVDNLAAIVKVLTTIGSFAACKIYYKDYRNSVRSSQAAQ